MRSALVLLAFVVAACADVDEPSYDKLGLPFPRLVYVDDGAAADELAQLEAQLELWNAFAGAPVFELRATSTMQSTGCVIRVELYDDLGSVGEAVRAGQFVTRPGQCWGRLRLRRDRLGTVAPAHELGHSLGLGHTRDPSDVMNERRAPGPQELKPYVLEHLQQLPQWGAP